MEQSDSSSSEPVAGEERAEAIGPGQASEAVQLLGPGGAGATCSSNCNCQTFHECVNGTCQYTAPIGGHPPPPGDYCKSDCQCGNLTGYCTNNNNPSQWGYCVATTCAISWSPTVVAAGATTIMTLSSTGMPANAYTRLYGQKNGLPDPSAGGAQFNVTSGSFPITNGPGMAGHYTRWVRMYTSYGQQICQSGSSSVLFQ